MTVTRRAVKRRKTEAEIDAEVDRFNTKEWTDYLPEMLDAIKRGYFDSIITDVQRALATRRDNIHTVNASAKLVVTTAHNVHGLYDNVVRIKNDVNPALLRGKLLHVERIAETTVHGKLLDPPNERWSGKCSIHFTALDVKFETPPPPPRRRRRRYNDDLCTFN